jgi:peptide/nickel transport system substrate-binding protein
MKNDDGVSTAERRDRIHRDRPRGALTRRTLLTRAGATGLALFGTPGLLAACTSPQGAPQASGAATARAGRAGGRITWAYSSEPAAIDPHTSGSATTAEFAYRVYDQLTTFDADGKVAPNVAASWSQPNPNSWVFKLRDNVKFSNGRQMKAADVVKSFQRYWDPKISGAALKPGPLKEVRAIDDLTVQFDLERPHPPFPALMARASAAILPMQEFEAGTYDPKKDFLGTGPFVVKEQLKGEQWTFVKNPNYWRAGFPKIDELVILIVPDPSARVAALKSARADIAYFDNIDAPQLLAGNSNITVVQQTAPEFNNIPINAKTPLNPALKDPRVRQAINLAIDRDQIVRTVLGGQGKAVYGTIPGLPDECDASKLPKRDVAKAKLLLAEAGATGLSFELLVFSNYPDLVQLAQVVKQSLSDAGIDMKIQVLDQGTVLQRLGLGSDPVAKFDAYTNFTSGYGDNWVALSAFSAVVSAYSNKYQLENPAFDALLDKARTAAPGQERQAIFQQACASVAETGNIIPLTTRFYTVAYRNDKINAQVTSYEATVNYVRFVAEYTRKD